MLVRLYTMEIKGLHNNILSVTGHVPIFMSTDFRLLIVAIWMIYGDITILIMNLLPPDPLRLTYQMCYFDLLL
jgi:hypothetical protein